MQSQSLGLDFQEYARADRTCPLRRFFGGPPSPVRPSPRPQSERDIVVHVVVARTAGGDRAARRGTGLSATEIAAAGIVGPKAAATAAGAAVEHGQGRVKPLQHHFGRVFLD